ncbi:MAG: MvdC family ATP-grasp ribosomal peptide maturase [Planctomycetes bacterium]|nr:MvdC family ATP-grasp ribosomal peptide maturase [Planctomycetota bacterium]
MTAPAPTVLLLTHSQDVFVVERVAAALAERGARAERLNTDEFPAKLRLASWLGHDGHDQRMFRREQTLDASAVAAVWTRKLWAPALPDSLDPRLREACVKESLAALRAFLLGLRPYRWLDHPEPIREAGDKIGQLRAALGAGLAIPRTLVTNDPGSVRRFHADTQGATVAKLLTHLGNSTERAPLFVPTSRIGEDDLAELDSLRHCPMVFQEQIPKDRDLRIVYVAGRLFVAAVDAAGSQAGSVDWRRAAPEECRWQRDEVPRAVSDGIRMLMTDLGLGFGVLDMIRTPSGDHVFLEVNPTGEWGMLERDLGLPIAETIAEALLAPSRGAR